MFFLNKSSSDGRFLVLDLNKLLVNKLTGFSVLRTGLAWVVTFSLETGWNLEGRALNRL